MNEYNKAFGQQASLSNFTKMNRTEKVLLGYPVNFQIQVMLSLDGVFSTKLKVQRLYF